MKTRTLIFSAFAAAVAYFVVRGRRHAAHLAREGAAAFEGAATAANPGEAVGRMGLGANVAPVTREGSETVRPGLGDFLRGA